MGRMKELWEEQFYAESPLDDAIAKAEFIKTRVAETEARLAQEREWAGLHPNEWSEWLRIQSLLVWTFDFGVSKSFDFPEFLAELGPSPSAKHLVVRRDETLPYMTANLVWSRSPTEKADPRPVDSPYLNVDEAAAYCRRAPQTLYNHHSLGNVRSVTQSRPILFRREDLDAWLGRRKTRR